MRYRKIFIVRWADCDLNGHMRNTAYSECAIETRLGFLAEQGFPFQKMKELGFGPVILREEIDYLREVGLGDTIEVDLTKVGLSPDGARWKLAHDFWRPGGKKAARIVISGGWLDLAARKLVVPPEPLARAMREVEPGEGYADLPALGVKQP